jgi:hypothetical protein
MILVRYQRLRRRNWRKPPNTVNVTRPGKWGNPHKPGVSLVNNGDGTYRRMSPQDAVDAYRRDLPFWIAHKMVPPLEQLRGKNLMCFCGLDYPCHADVLLEFANR